MFLKCQCCLDSGAGNRGCGDENHINAPICTAYGTNAADTGRGTCGLISNRTTKNYDSFVRYFFY